jgi:glycerate 2-kinase
VASVADGGDGSARAVLDAAGGKWISRRVHGPHMRMVRSGFALLSDRKTAVIELAAASGLALVPSGKNDPRTATTFGTGELIGAAVKAGARRVILAIGGSATNDGGTGALSALGARFVDGRGKPLRPGGAALAHLAKVDTSSLAATLRGVSIEIACDVDNPLTGRRGASAIYGPQKGASPKDVRELDKALAHFADVVEKTTGRDLRGVPGAGAAGGVGFGFLALAGARIERGARLILDAIGFERRMNGVDLVVTGEGALDKQTLSGKTPYAVAQAANKRGIPAVAIAGSVDLHGHDFERFGVVTAASTTDRPMTLDEAMARAAELAADAAERLGRGLALGAIGARKHRARPR